jgi:hypothetical protein
VPASDGCKLERADKLPQAAYYNPVGA